MTASRSLSERVTRRPRDAAPTTHAPDLMKSASRPIAHIDVRQALALHVGLPHTDGQRWIDAAGAGARLELDLFDGLPVVSVIRLVARRWWVTTAGRDLPWAAGDAGGGLADDGGQVWVGVRLMAKLDGRPVWLALGEYDSLPQSFLATPALGMRVQPTRVETWAAPDRFAAASVSLPAERLARFALRRSSLLTAESGVLRTIHLTSPALDWRPLAPDRWPNALLEQAAMSSADRWLGAHVWDEADGAATNNGRWTLHAPVCAAGAGCTRVWEMDPLGD